MRGGEVRAGRREGLWCGGGTTSGMHGEMARLKAWGAKGTRGAHVEHAAHVCDAGGVEAQRLVEGRRDLQSRREGMRCGGEKCEPGGGRACGVCWWHTRGMHWEGPTQGLGAKGTRGAHQEHFDHGRDAGGVEAQRLVEGRRALQSRRGGHAMRGGRSGSREAGGPGVWWRHDKRHARGKGPTQGLGAKGTRGAHSEHVAHVRDAGGVEAQRLVEGRRVLPSRGEGMRCGGKRCASRETGGPLWGGCGTQEACTGKP